MRKVFIIIGMIITIFSCQQNSNSTIASTDPNIHMGVALEKINTSQYTYLLVNENGVETWLAFPLAEVKIGETYYYVNEMLMNNFVSKELGRTFEKVYFISEVFTELPTKVNGGNTVHSNPQPLPPNHPQINQQSSQQQMLQNKNITTAPEIAAPANSNMHNGIALEKINTSQYTYLLLNENGVKTWLAFPLSDVKIGETYYYAGEMLMTNFESKELKRVFEKVYFVQGVTTRSKQ